LDGMFHKYFSSRVINKLAQIWMDVKSCMNARMFGIASVRLTFKNIE